MSILYNQVTETKWDFLDSGSYIMDGIISLHDHILFYEIILLTLVIWFIFYVLINQNMFGIKNFTHHSILEIVWTIVPSFVLILIVLPSFRLLYLMDDLLLPNLTIKVIGHQWYWSYNYVNNNNELVEFDSYINNDLSLGDIRNYDVDEHLIIPSNTYIRFIVTSTDVLHSWGIPALGVKMDAVPGRLNQLGLEVYRAGIYYGSCYELCGINHSFMPITVKVI